MNSESINNLNSLLESEYMAINSFEALIKHAINVTVKTELQKIQQTHKQHTLQISDKIRDLRGSPSGSIGIQGIVSETISNIKHIGTTDNTSYLKEALQSEFMAIKTINALIAGNSILNNSTILYEIITDHKTNIDSLNNIINTSNNIR